jgi:WD40 repeat protein
MNSVVWVPLDGTRFGEPVELVPSRGVWRWTAAFDPSGRFLVTAPFSAATPQQQLLESIDLETREVRTCPLVEADAIDGFRPGYGGISGVNFASDGTLFTTGHGGVWRWDLETCAGKLVYEQDGSSYGDMSRDGRLMVHVIYDMSDAWQIQDPGLLDLERGVKSPLPGGQYRMGWGNDFDPSGRVVAVGHVDGVVRVSPLPDGQPHLLVGHEDAVKSVVVSPDGRWIASSTDSEIRLWPMPDVSGPPFDTLPHDELMAKLDTLTNLRAVRDAEASTGWTLEIGPFPGWADLPEW